MPWSLLPACWRTAAGPRCFCCFGRNCCICWAPHFSQSRKALNIDRRISAYLIGQKKGRWLSPQRSLLEAPGADEITFETLPDSVIPAKLIERGYDGSPLTRHGASGSCRPRSRQRSSPREARCRSECRMLALCAWRAIPPACPDRGSQSDHCL